MDERHATIRGRADLHRIGRARLLNEVTVSPQPLGWKASRYTRDRRRPDPRVYFTGRRLGSIFEIPVPLFTSMIWSRRSAALLEFQIRRGGLHFLLQLAQQFGEIEIATGFANDRGLRFRVHAKWCASFPELRDARSEA